MAIEVVDEIDEYAQGYVQAVQDCIKLTVDHLKQWGAAASMDNLLDDMREILVPQE